MKALCDLEVGYGGVWAANFGGAALGFEPRNSCMRVRSLAIMLQGRAAPIAIVIKNREKQYLEFVSRAVRQKTVNRRFKIQLPSL